MNIKIDKLNEIQENVNSAKDIDLKLHDNTIKTELFNVFSSKIVINTYKKEFNKIYWLSYMGYMVSLTDIYQNTKPDKPIKYNIMHLRLFHPLMEIFEELCELSIGKTVYHSFLSNLMRQLIEIIILNKELDENDIEDKKIFEAAIASYNKQINTDTSMFQNLILKNRGLFKAFGKRIYMNKLIDKCHYKTGYRVFSGDIHSPASIEKLFPTLRESKSRFNEIYLGMTISLITEMLEYLISKVNYLQDYKINIENEYTVH
jgi:hypothetical protein